MRGQNKRPDARRWTALIGALFLAVGAQAGLLLATSTPATAVPGLVPTAGFFLGPNTTAIKALDRTCPAGTVLMGIGGTANDSGANSTRLTALQPLSNTQFRVQAATAAGFTGSWQLGAQARCAQPPTGYQIISNTTATSSATFQGAIATCTNGRVAIGSGAVVNTSNAGLQEVALQLLRTTGTMDAVRATAREDGNGFSGTWSVTAYAICVNAVPNQAPAAGGLFFGVANASVTCPAGTFVHGFGGGGSTSDVTGNVWLRHISASNQTANAGFTGIPGDGIIAHAICAT